MWRQAVWKNVFKQDHQTKIFVVGNIDGWLHDKKIFSLKTKSIVARYECMDSLKIPTIIVLFTY